MFPETSKHALQFFCIHSKPRHIFATQRSLSSPADWTPSSQPPNAMCTRPVVFKSIPAACRRCVACMHITFGVQSTITFTLIDFYCVGVHFFDWWPRKRATNAAGWKLIYIFKCVIESIRWTEISTCAIRTKASFRRTMLGQFDTRQMGSSPRTDLHTQTHTTNKSTRISTRAVRRSNGQSLRSRVQNHMCTHFERFRCTRF